LSTELNPFLFNVEKEFLDTMPPKRKNTGKQAGNNKTKQSKQDGQKAVSHDLNVPIDEGFNLSAKVYIDDDGVIFDASLNQTNIGDNNNKVYPLRFLIQRTLAEISVVLQTAASLRRKERRILRAHTMG